MRRISVHEGVPFSVSDDLAIKLRSAAARLTTQLRPRLSCFKEDRGQFVIQNVIGTIRLDDTTTVEVSPKIGPDKDWVSAVLDLLEGVDRIDVAGERLGGLTPRRPELLDVLGSVYAVRLRRALRRDGPLRLIERRNEVLGLFRGKLKTVQYVIHAQRYPHRFPVSFDELSVDNDFSRGMALVARLLSTVSTSPQVRASLVESAAALRPNFPETVRVHPSIVSRPFPPQWSVYRPAWSIAVAVLSRMSLLHTTGRHHGVEVAIEAWPLLERLLKRALDEASSITSAVDQPLEREPKPSSLLLKASTSNLSSRSVEPDGQLVSRSNTAATFEAKYSPRGTGSVWPAREHVFQAVATASACRSPLAVLVYPENFEPCWWDVQVAGGHPGHLVAIGLDLFSYRRGPGDHERGKRLVRLLSDPRLSGGSSK